MTPPSPNLIPVDAYEAIENRQKKILKLEIMKEMGVNAIRTAHNPPSPEQLDLCDEMGFLVQEEFFDEEAVKAIDLSHISDYRFSYEWEKMEQKNMGRHCN